MDTKEDWKKYRNTSTDHEVASGNNLTHVQLAQDSNSSVPHEAAGAQAAQCNPATKVESEKENKSIDEDPSKDNLSRANLHLNPNVQLHMQLQLTAH